MRKFKVNSLTSLFFSLFSLSLFFHSRHSNAEQGSCAAACRAAPPELAAPAAAPLLPRRPATPPRRCCHPACFVAARWSSSTSRPDARSATPPRRQATAPSLPCPCLRPSLGRCPPARAARPPQHHLPSLVRLFEAELGPCTRAPRTAAAIVAAEHGLAAEPPPPPFLAPKRPRT